MLLLFGLPVAASGDLLSDDEPAANGKTPLMTAAREGDAAAVNRLIAAGADVNEANAGGATALMFATLSGDPMVTSLLLRAGARADSKAKLGWTALALAAVKGYTEVGEVLLDAGASQGVRDAYGERIPELTPSEAARLIDDGAITHSLVIAAHDHLQRGIGRDRLLHRDEGGEEGEPPELRDAGNGDADQSIQELIHALGTQGHLADDRPAVTHLEARD